MLARRVRPTVAGGLLAAFLARRRRPGEEFDVWPGVLAEAAVVEGFCRAEVRGFLSAVVGEFRHEVPQDRVSEIDVVPYQPSLGLLGGLFYPNSDAGAVPHVVLVFRFCARGYGPGCPVVK